MSKKIPKILKNRYILVMIAFVVYVTFFDAHDLISQIQIKWKLHKINEQKEYLETELQDAKVQTEELTTNKEMLEKFAREQYRMKRENEDVFVILKENEE